jgi:hypothetical protein
MYQLNGIAMLFCLGHSIKFTTYMYPWHSEIYATHYYLVVYDITNAVCIVVSRYLWEIGSWIPCRPKSVDAQVPHIKWC